WGAVWGGAAPPLARPPPPGARRGPRRGGGGGGGWGVVWGGVRPPPRDRVQAVIPNGLAVQIVYRNERAEGEVRLGDAWRVKPTDDLLVALRGEFADSSVEIVY
ncbi:hypothetical protein, partial [Paraburkholderia sp.]|uniref:hypothetical protein n=1 Tax=Paraburkholderia sp. TaxID=1926495 RepID=UPI0038621237